MFEVKGALLGCVSYIGKNEKNCIIQRQFDPCLPYDIYLYTWHIHGLHPCTIKMHLILRIEGEKTNGKFTSCPRRFVLQTFRPSL